MQGKKIILIISIIVVILLTACTPNVAVLPVASWTTTLKLGTFKLGLNAPMPVVYTVDGKVFDDPEAAAKRDSACSTLVPINLKQVINNSLPDQPIAWRVNLNFKVQAADGNPLGCFRLFEVIPGAKGVAPTIQAIDGGGFLINTCFMKGGVSIEPSQAQAVFASQGYIQCKTNLRGWVAALKDHLTDVKNQKAVELMSQQTAQRYGNLVMYGRGALWPGGAPGQGDPRSPVAAYAPVVSEPNAYPPLAISLFTNRLSSWASLDAFINGIDYRTMTSNTVNCNYENIKTRHDWWMDFRYTDSALRFGWREFGGATQGVHLCQALQPALPVGQLLDFWIDEATLTLGYSPQTATTPEQWSSGTLEEFVLDPTDSKPPV